MLQVPEMVSQVGNRSRSYVPVLVQAATVRAASWVLAEAAVGMPGYMQNVRNGFDNGQLRRLHTYGSGHRQGLGDGVRGRDGRGDGRAGDHEQSSSDLHGDGSERADR